MTRTTKKVLMNKNLTLMAEGLSNTHAHWLNRANWASLCHLSLLFHLPCVHRPYVRLQWACLMLYKEQFAAEHYFSWIMWCHRHMWLIYITSLHYYWYILLLIVHTANMNYSLVIIHIMLNHCPGTTRLRSLALSLSLSALNILKFPFFSAFFS